jgi:hypothetical protein
VNPVEVKDCRAALVLASCNSTPAKKFNGFFLFVRNKRERGNQHQRVSCLPNIDGWQASLAQFPQEIIPASPKAM